MTDDQQGFYGNKANTVEPNSERLKRFYKPQPLSVTKADYDDWASDYDQNTVKDIGYCAPESIASLVEKHIKDKNLPIIDLGCGTGLLGKLLKPRGYNNIHGWDLSPGMLAEAEKTGAYASLKEIDLTVRFPFEAESCRAMVSAGVYGPGVVGPEHVHLLVPPLAKGGVSIHSFNGLSWRKRPFGDAIQVLKDSGEIDILEQSWGPYITGENIDGVYMVFCRR